MSEKKDRRPLAPDGHVIKLAIMGINGSQGRLLAKLGLDLGYDLIGGVGRNDRVGKPVSAFVEHPKLIDDIRVYGSFEDLEEAVGKPDVAMMCALLPVEKTVEISTQLLRRGINVVSMEADLVDPDLPALKELDAAGKEGGATMMIGGLQDLWWVQLPSVAIAANHNIKRFTLDEDSNLGMASKADGQWAAALNYTLEEYAEWEKGILADPGNAIMAPSLKCLAKRLGFTPLETTFAVDHFVCEKPVYWWEIDEWIQPGRIQGVKYRSETMTEEGVVFAGSLRWMVRDREEESYTASISESDLKTITVKVPDFDAVFNTATATLRRFTDVVWADPGCNTLDTLPPLKYSHPLK